MIYNISQLKRLTPNTIFVRGTSVYIKENCFIMKKDTSILELLNKFKGYEIKVWGDIKRK
jgi:hypothetical protein